MEWGRHGLGFGGLLVIYFAVPLGSGVPTWRLVVGVVATLSAVWLAGWVIYRQLRVDLDGHGRQVGVHRLLLVLEVIVIAFAMAYFLIARSTSSQFVGIDSRLDALYLTLVTLSTVGFGDVRAEGQVARAVVSGQIVFDLVFVGALAGLLSRRIRGAPAPRTPGYIDVLDDGE